VRLGEACAKQTTAPDKVGTPGAAMSTWFSYSTSSVASTRPSSKVLAMTYSPAVIAQRVAVVTYDLLGAESSAGWTSPTHP
jgi:hypothetical protein